MTQRPPLVLDLGNVLVNLDFERFVRRVSAESSREAGEVRDRYILGESKRRYERGEIDCQAFFGEMAMWLSWPHDQMETLRRAWCDIFEEAPGAAVAMGQLSRSWRLWLLSDTNPSHLAWCRGRWPWLDGCERFFVSHEQGRLKAEPGGFAPIVEAAGAQPPAIFYDDLEANVAAARRAGVDGRLFTGWGSALADLI